MQGRIDRVLVGTCPGEGIGCRAGAAECGPPQRGDLAPALKLALWSLWFNAGLLALGAAWLRGGL